MCVSTCPPAHVCHVSTRLCVSTRLHVLGSCVASWLSYQSGNSREGPDDPLRPRARLVARDPEVGRRLVAFSLTGGEGGALGPWAEDP